MEVLIPTKREQPLAIWSMLRLGAGALEPIDHKYISGVIDDCASENICEECPYKAQCVVLYDRLRLPQRYVTGPNE